MDLILKSRFQVYVFISLALLLASFTPSSQAAVNDVSKIVIRSHAGTGSGIIQIAEVIATDASTGADRAIAGSGASVTSSGIYSNNNRYGAENAIDGDTTPGRDALQNYYHSLSESNQSLSVNFATPVNLSELTLVGRADCCANRDIYTVEFLDQAGNVLLNLPELDANNSSHSASQALDAGGDSQNGDSLAVRNIIIEVNASSGSDYLQIAEVIAIDAVTGQDVALDSRGASVTSVSVYQNIIRDRFSAELAIDGATGPGISDNYYHSDSGAGQRLTVRLASDTKLSGISIVGRSSCCSNRDIYNVMLTDNAGSVVAQRTGLNANNALHRIEWDLEPAAPPNLSQTGQWGEVMDWPLVAVSMANLPDGRILTYSGSERRTWPSTEQTYSATWDPLTGQFDETLHLGHNMFCAAMSMTSEGQVFVNGGRNSGNSPWTSLFNYQDNQWTQIENMASGGRWYPTTLTLGDGKILTAMGNSTNVRNPDLWSASSGWRVLNGIDFLSMRTRRNEIQRENVFPLLSQAPNGSVYHYWDTVENHYLSVEGNGSASSANASTDSNAHAGGVQVMYDEGKLLVSGANDGSWGGNSSAISANAFTVDLNGSVPQLQASQAMNFPRKFHQMIPLPDGEVLVVGGNTTGSKFQDNGSVLNAEIWNQQSREFRVVAPLTIPRDYHSTAVLMIDGRIITAGGGYHPNDPSSGGTHQDAQIYSPGYLFNSSNQLANRPTVVADTDRVDHGGTIAVSTTGNIDFFSLVKMSATTHAINTDARFLKPTFANTGSNRYSISFHTNPNVATPGYWMLFAVNSAGVPSIADIILVESVIDDGPDGGPIEIEPIVSTPAQIGQNGQYSVNASGGNLTYSWNFGDNTGDTPFTSQTTTTHQFNQPGHYVVTVTAMNAAGDTVTETFIQVVHNPLTASSAVHSGAISEITARNQLWSVNPDNDSVTVINTNSLARTAEISVGDNPRALAVAPDGDVWVVNKHSASVTVINAADLSVRRTHALDSGSLPHGIVFGNNSAYVALEGLSSIVQLNASNGSELRRRFTGDNPRHLSLNGEQNRLYVSNFITPALPGESGQNPQVVGNGGTVQRFITSDSVLGLDRTILLGHSNRGISEHSGPGMPNYLGPVAISPDGINAWVPSKQDNILAGTRRGGGGMTFDQTVRAVTSHIDLTAGNELLARRVDHDNASVASHAAFDPFGLTLFVALEGNRQIALIDVNTAIEVARFDTGHAPQSVLVSEDGTRLYVHNFTDRSIGVHDVASVVNQGTTEVSEIAVISTVSNEKLAANVLRGKRLFYDARDDRLAALDYMSCASCHNEAGHDGRVWDFTGSGEGLRNTISLIGVAGDRNGLLHWSANFDEVQDFEGQIRDFAGGTGLMSNADFQAGSRSSPLGDRKAGLSTDLDALAAYLDSLDEVLPSPFRSGAELTATAQVGKDLFAAKGCADCHSGSNFTDSGDTANLHDIGTLDQDSGDRLFAALTGIDTPTLLDAWHTAPYLHDGSSATIRDAILAHNTVSLSANEASSLAEYVLQIDASESGTSPPSPTSINVGGDPTQDANAIDGWRSNLVINERDSYVNSSGENQTIDIELFNFYARRVAAPVTPFVARRVADNNFIVLAIGTTRSQYQIGQNAFVFDNAGIRSVNLADGETLVAGFLDANADGTSSGPQSVIPFNYVGAEIWYSGGFNATQSASISEGSPPTSGASVLTDQFRDYRFNITITPN